MSSKKKDKRGEGGGVDEVEALLQAAEDELLLKLTLNSHIAHTSSSSSYPLDQHLMSRFQALKKPSSAPSKIITQQLVPSSIQQQHEHDGDDDELEKVLGSRLSARFSALKAASSSSSPLISSSREIHDVAYMEDHDDDDDDEEDEVEKLMRWAMDAARLDPSSETDEDDSKSRRKPLSK